MQRGLDGVYFRILDTDGRFKNICFSDLTTEQREDVMENKSMEWLKSMCQILADTIKEIGDEFDLIGEEAE